LAPADGDGTLEKLERFLVRRRACGRIWKSIAFGQIQRAREPVNIRTIARVGQRVEYLHSPLRFLDGAIQVRIHNVLSIKHGSEQAVDLEAVGTGSHTGFPHGTLVLPIAVP